MSNTAKGFKSGGEVAQINMCENEVMFNAELASQSATARYNGSLRVKKLLASAVLFVMALLFCSSVLMSTLCYTITASDGNLWANFNGDASNMQIEYSTMNTNALTTATVSNLKNTAKKRFNNNYNLQIALHFELSNKNTNERLTDFSDLTSVEMLVSIDGQANTASDAYCAVFISLDAEAEAEVLGGNYSLLDNAVGVGKTISVTTTGEGKLNLTIDADSDGFLFIMAIGNSDKDNMGMLIMIGSCVITFVLVALLLYTLRKYQTQRRRKQVAKQVQDLSALDSNSIMSAKVAKNFEEANAKSNRDKTAKSKSNASANVNATKNIKNNETAQVKNEIEKNNNNSEQNNAQNTTIKPKMPAPKIAKSQTQNNATIESEIKLDSQNDKNENDAK